MLGQKLLPSVYYRSILTKWNTDLRFLFCPPNRWISIKQGNQILYSEWETANFSPLWLLTPKTSYHYHIFTVEQSEFFSWASEINGREISIWIAWRKPGIESGSTERCLEKANPHHLAQFSVLWITTHQWRGRLLVSGGGTNEWCKYAWEWKERKN